MSSLLANRRDWKRRANPAVRTVVPVVFAMGLCTILGAAAAHPAFVPAAVAAAIALFLCVASVRAPASTLIALVIWLAVLGTVRRVFDAAGFDAYSIQLLLVSPTVVVALVVVAASRGAFQSRTSLTSGVLWLTAVVVLSALNPLQGGGAVGIGGLFFVLFPMLWFWVGRAILDDHTLGRLLRVISVLAVPAALYGLIQVYSGFPSWDEHWIETKGYVALQVGDSLRQFSSFASTTEYVGFIAIGALVWTLSLRRLRGAMPAGLALAILGWALALASARAILVALPVAFGLIFAASRGFGVVKSILYGVAGLAILGFVVSNIVPGSVGGSRTSALLSRQVQGLADPLNAEVSTLPGHVEQLVSGVASGFRNPVGRGVGSVTIAAERFEGERAGTESDPSNIAVAAGIPGLLAYAAVVILGFRVAFKTARQRRDLVSLVALGILVVTSFQWMNGGAYSVAPLPWLVLGWLDRTSLRGSAASRPTPSLAMST